jgi:hypothetical protein
MPTYLKPADVEIRQLKACLLKLIDDLNARAEKATQAPASDAWAHQLAEERALVYREQALTLRYLLESVEAMDPALEENRYKSTVLMAASKASLSVRKSGRPGG